MNACPCASRRDRYAYSGRTRRGAGVAVVAPEVAALARTGATLGHPHGPGPRIPWDAICGPTRGTRRGQWRRPRGRSGESWEAGILRTSEAGRLGRFSGFQDFRFSTLTPRTSHLATAGVAWRASSLARCAHDDEEGREAGNLRGWRSHGLAWIFKFPFIEILPPARC